MRQPGCASASRMGNPSVRAQRILRLFPFKRIHYGVFLYRLAAVRNLRVRPASDGIAFDACWPHFDSILPGLLLLLNCIGYKARMRLANKHLE